ncbi:MAG TPA: hypothetical protein VHC21_04465 [Candidatus Saccharimonadales bacterium]|nr:hypothetical protein [Candidatus Saccharimonadales bacterium]
MNTSHIDPKVSSWNLFTVLFFFPSFAKVFDAEKYGHQQNRDDEYFFGQWLVRGKSQQHHANHLFRRKGSRKLNTRGTAKPSLSYLYRIPALLSK